MDDQTNPTLSGLDGKRIKVQTKVSFGLAPHRRLISIAAETTNIKETIAYEPRENEDEAIDAIRPNLPSRSREYELEMHAMFGYCLQPWCHAEALRKEPCG